jgi:hypothetical protein
MKLGNYKWETCPKCGIRYGYIPGKKKHKCKKYPIRDFITNLIDRILNKN